MRRFFAFTALSTFILSGACGGSEPPSRNNGSTSDFESFVKVVDPQFHTPSFLQPYGEHPAVLDDHESAEQAARNTLEEYAATMGVENVAAEFELEKVSTDGLDMTHVAFRQLAGGYPVFGMRYGVHFDRLGRVAYVSGRYVPNLSKADLSSKLDSAKAIDLAIQDLEKEVAPHALTQPLGNPTSRPVVFTLDDNPRMAYDIELAYTEETFIGMQYIVDANDGSIIRRIPTMRNAMVSGSGQGVLYHARDDKTDIKEFKVSDVTKKTSSPRYQLKRPASAEGFAITVYEGLNEIGGAGATIVESTDPHSWDTTGPSPGQAVDGYYYLQVVDKYHRQVHSRKSYDGLDSPVSVFVHVSQAEDNAFYYNGGVYAGDIVQSLPNASYIGSLDVVAHEFQHGVNRHTLDLLYEFQSGAIDEGLADIFGCLVEHFHAPHATNNALVGEASTFPDNDPIRNTANPRALNDPDHMDTYRDLSESYDRGGVHINSTVISHAWYLMTVGGKNVTSKVEVKNPIGWSESEKLWNAVVEGRTQAPTMAFMDFARVTIATAYQLKSASQSSTPVSPVVAQDGKVQSPPSAVRTVGCAWYAVGVLSQEEIEKHWGIVCDGDASEGPGLDCFTGGPKCTDNQVCSWNGPDNGYCCKAPWKGTETCFSDKECAPGICARGENDRFYCTNPNEVPCEDGPPVSSSGDPGGSEGASGSGGTNDSGDSAENGPDCDGSEVRSGFRQASLAPALLFAGLALFRRRRP